jgi:hypothetical protein
MCDYERFMNAFVMIWFVLACSTVIEAVFAPSGWMVNVEHALSQCLCLVPLWWEARRQSEHFSENGSLRS